MCVIIYREPKVSIPFEKLVSACLVNADGMGIVSVDRGKLELRKYFFDKGNDPEVLAKALEDAKDLHTYVHLRYRTKGPKDKSNVHPFGVLKSKKHGLDIQFMHNGTLSSFGDTTNCDSKDFAKSILTPLSERFLQTVDKEELLLDKVYTNIIKQYAGTTSVFLMMDNLGNHNIFNMNNGKAFNGWWASNEYSFNRYHREPSTTYYNSGRRTYWPDDDKDDAGWSKMYGKHQAASEAESKPKVTVAALPSPKSGGDTTPPFNDEIPFDTAKAEAKAPIVIPKDAPKLSLRDTFVEVAGLQQLSDVCNLSYTDICDLVDDYPEHAVLLIQDLLKELYDRDQEYDDTVAEEKVA